MTKDTLALKNLIANEPDADMLREMISFAAQKLMDMEVSAQIGAPPYGRGEERTNSVSPPTFKVHFSRILDRQSIATLCADADPPTLSIKYFLMRNILVVEETSVSDFVDPRAAQAFYHCRAPFFQSPQKIGSTAANLSSPKSPT